MRRTQVYLTDGQAAQLEALSKAVGKKRSELIREAVDLLLAQRGHTRQKIILRRAAGMWRDRNDLPDYEALRKEWNRES